MRVSSTTNSPNTEVAGTRQSKAAAVAAEAKKKDKAAGANSANAPLEGGSVKAELSAKGKEFARAKAVANGAPDVREEKIAELKRRITEGKYKVNAEEVANRMVDEHLKTSGS